MEKVQGYHRFCVEINKQHEALTLLKLHFTPSLPVRHLETQGGGGGGLPNEEARNARRKI